ncbi:MAG TPA: SLC13 family permease [Geminicoccaceae bacterium]|nr:SLC13 family permease [Geminicoccus sp.]HMU51329.1 SLC13 family permease [Geminicoccaceae bacterium]
MTTDLAIVLALLAAAVVMFAINRPRMDAVALIMLTVLPLTGVITMGEALAGFSDPNIILIAALFVIGEGLVRTGVAQRLGDWLVARAGSDETRLLVLLMAVVAALGSVMSSTGVVAIFIPIVLRIAQGTGSSPGRLMMPLSMAALISGMMTLVATAPNLVVNAELVRSGASGFGFFSFTPFGLPILVLGIGYMLFARRWLAAASEGARGPGGRPRLREWVEVYGLAGREHRVRVTARSPLVGRMLEELRLRDTSGANLLAIERPARFSVDVIRPLGKTVVRAGDTLLIDLFAPDADIAGLRDELALEALPSSGGYFIDRAQQLGMVEVMLPYGSALIGKTLIGAEFRTRYGLNAVGLRRGRTAFGPAFKEEELKVGDTLLLVGFWKELQKLPMMRADLLVLDFPAELDDVLPAGRFAPQALACLALVIGLMVSGIVPNVQAALIGCLLMGALRCVDLASAYRSIHWSSLVLIVGMLPFSVALQRTGGVDLAANALVSLVGDASPHVVLASLFAITAVLGLFISNTATAVLMAPVALAIAKELGASPYPFAMIVALAASAAFMTPVSSPVNTLVVGPGNYAFGDFVRIGVPFTLVVMAVSVILVPLLLPL